MRACPPEVVGYSGYDFGRTKLGRTPDSGKATRRCDLIEPNEVVPRIGSRIVISVGLRKPIACDLYALALN